MFNYNNYEIMNVPTNIHPEKHPTGTTITWDFSGMSCKFETDLILSYEEAIEFVNNLSREDHEDYLEVYEKEPEGTGADPEWYENY